MTDKTSAVRAALLGCGYAAALATTGSSARADEIVSGGEVGLAVEAYRPDGDDDTHDYSASLTARLEAKYRDRPWRFRAAAFGRADQTYDEKTIAALEEAWGEWRDGPWRVRVGAQIATWTALDVFHPADAINSRHYEAGFAYPDKLGEPMALIERSAGDGAVQVLAMPARIEPTIPDGASRWSLLPEALVLGDPVWVDARGQVADGPLAPQGAVRVSQTFGHMDAAVHVLHHRDRDLPTLGVRADTGEPVAVFRTVTQAGATWQWQRGGFIWKAEGAYRFVHDDDDEVAATVLAEPLPSHGAIAAGFEYSWMSSAASSTVLVEGQALAGPSAAERLRLHPFQGDVMIGYRRLWNDTAGRRLLAAVIADVEHADELMATAEYSRRLGDLWRWTAGARAIVSSRDRDEPGLAPLSRHQAVYTSLIRGF